MNKVEEKLTIQIVDWLILRYPNVLFRVDLGGMYIRSIGLKVKAAKFSRGSDLEIEKPYYPDLAIHQIRPPWAGLFVEIKATPEKYKRKDGTVRQSKHIQGQIKYLKRLREKGYYGDMAGGFDEVTNLIEWYLEGEGKFWIGTVIDEKEISDF